MCGRVDYKFSSARKYAYYVVACMTGRKEILDVYKYAVGKKYRFFSFGDAMLVL